MLSLETLDLLLAITEGEMIEEMIVGMLAAPQLSVFFKKFPAIRRALDRDLPRWKLQLKGASAGGHGAAGAGAGILPLPTVPTGE